jgi:hypothetical protein
LLAAGVVGCPGEFGGLALDPADTGTPSSEAATVDSPASDASGDARQAPTWDASARDTASDDVFESEASPDGHWVARMDSGVDSDTTDVEAGCGPTDTITSCGACGRRCDTLTGTPSCSGGVCTYACNAGTSDCNASIAPDTDGCECATPACCNGHCQTAHDNGLGQTFYDCNPAGTYDSAAAMAACKAYVTSTGGDPSLCTGGWNCNNAVAVCYSTSGGCTNCWNYTGSLIGVADDCGCPGTKLGSWN